LLLELVELLLQRIDSRRLPLSASSAPTNISTACWTSDSAINASARSLAIRVGIPRLPPRKRSRPAFVGLFSQAIVRAAMRRSRHAGRWPALGERFNAGRLSGAAGAESCAVRETVRTHAARSRGPHGRSVRTVRSSTSIGQHHVRQMSATPVAVR
jgi:hypothetical protein